MVFQSYAVWPHMSVFQTNVAFPLKWSVRTLPAPRSSRKSCMRWTSSNGPVSPIGPHRFERRPATARGLGSSACRRAEGLADGRATQQPRCPLARRSARRNQNPVAKIRVFRACLRHPRPGRGDGPRRSRGGDEQRQSAAKRAPPRLLYAMPSSREVCEFLGATNLLDGVTATADKSTPAGQIDMRDSPDATPNQISVAIRPEELELCRALRAR